MQLRDHQLRCDTCELDLRELELQLTLRAPHHSISCPVCGVRLVETVELADSFYDEQGGGAYVVWNTQSLQPQAQGQTTERFGRLEVTVVGKSVKPRDICYDRVIVYQHEGETVLPYTGVRPEFMRYLRPGAAVTPGKWSPPKFIFEAALRGGPKVTIQLPAMSSKSEPGPQPNSYAKATALNIWPNFRRKGWHNYFVYFVSTDPNALTRSVRVIGEEPGQEQVFAYTVPRGEVRFVPAYVEITVADAAGAEYSSCYRVEFGDRERVQEPAGVDRPILSLDFGTSNTCFAVLLPGDRDVKVINFRDRTKRLIKGLNMDDSTSYTWLPEPEAGRPQNQLPSELNFSTEVRSLGSDLRGFQPVVDYTIPPFTRYRTEEEKFVVSEFKWERAFSSEQLSNLRPFTFDLQYLYLTLAVRMALAELASDPQCQRFDQIDFVATCPLAFSTEQRERFLNVIERVQANVHQQAGVRLALRKTYDESHAGEAGSGQMAGTTETIYVDVGGGTTDLGYFRFDEGGTDDEAIFLDSMQYAGDDIWKAITQGKLSGWAQIKFEREARARTAKSIFNDNDLTPFNDQARNLHRAAQGVKNFFGGLVEFVVRMIAAREEARAPDSQPPTKLGLYLLGNGWRFVEVFDDADAGGGADAIAVRVKRLVEERLRKYGIAAPPLVVKYPITNDLTPKTTVAIGAATLYYSETTGGRVPPEPEFTLRSFLGSDAVITTVGRQVVEWHTEVPHPLQTVRRVGSINYKIPSRFQFERPQVGDTRIESVNLTVPVLTTLNGRSCLGKNLFAYYLEQWHTKSLL